MDSARSCAHGHRRARHRAGSAGGTWSAASSPRAMGRSKARTDGRERRKARGRVRSAALELLETLDVAVELLFQARLLFARLSNRSEERRVGKGARSRW